MSDTWPAPVLTRYQVLKVPKRYAIIDDILGVVLAYCDTERGAFRFHEYLESEKSPCGCDLEQRVACEACLSRYETVRKGRKWSAKNARTRYQLATPCA